MLRTHIFAHMKHYCIAQHKPTDTNKTVYL